MLALHLFAVLHRLKGEGPEGSALAQELVDRFSQDMETVLRELGVSDLRVPQSMRRLAAASKGLFQDYETALASGPKRPSRTPSPRLCPARRKARSLAAGRSHPIYWLRSKRSTRQDIASLRAGAPDFAEASVKP